MKKVGILLLFVSIFIIVTFLLFSDFEIYVEENLNRQNSLISYISVSFIFLFTDILLPIPSSLIMMLNGKILGVVGGSILSMVSGLSSSVFGYYLGKKSSKYINKFFSQAEIDAGNAFFQKYGKLSVALSRALPIISEAVSVISGTTQMKWSQFLIYAGIGQLVVSILYAYLGAQLLEMSGHMITVIIVLGTLVLTWVISKVISKKVV